MRGLEWARVQEIRVTVCVLNEDVYASVKEVLNEWTEDSQNDDDEDPVVVPSFVPPASPDDAVPHSEVPTVRDAVFISYSHADSMWLKRLRVHLKPLERDHRISVWDDTRIQSGADWRNEIRKAIDNAKVAILLVSADFLASDFIATNELPPLLRAAAEDGAIILPVIVSPCRFSKTEGLARFQAVNDPQQPLKAMKGASREREFLKVVDAVEAAFK